MKEELNDEEKKNKSQEMILRIMVELDKALMAMEYLDRIEDENGEISEEDEEGFEEWLKKEMENFNPEDYVRNTPDEDNYEKPEEDEARIMYKGVGKPAVIWKVKKDGSDIIDIIGDEIDRIPYKDGMTILACKDRDKDELDPNIVLNDEIIRGTFLIIKDCDGILESLDSMTMLEIKDDMYNLRVRYVDENYRELPKNKLDEGLDER